MVTSVVYACDLSFCQIVDLTTPHTRILSTAALIDVPSAGSVSTSPFHASRPAFSLGARRLQNEIVRAMLGGWVLKVHVTDPERPLTS